MGRAATTGAGPARSSTPPGGSRVDREGGRKVRGGRTEAPHKRGMLRNEMPPAANTDGLAKRLEKVRSIGTEQFCRQVTALLVGLLPVFQQAVEVWFVHRR